jgi:hypothetical protein
MLHFDVLGLKTIRNGGGIAVPWWFITRQGVISIYEAGKLQIAREATFWHDSAPVTRLDQLRIIE